MALGVARAGAEGVRLGGADGAVLRKRIANVPERDAVVLERDGAVLAANLVAPRPARRPQRGARLDRADGAGRPNPESNARQFDASPRAAGTPGAGTWGALMRRVFDFDVLTCPRCGGRLRVLATVQDPLAVQAILAYLARSGAPAPPGLAPPAPAALT